MTANATFKLRKYGYVLTWTYMELKERWPPPLYVASQMTESYKKQFKRVYLSVGYLWLPMNVTKVYDISIRLRFMMPKIFSLKRHLKIAIKHDHSLIDAIKYVKKYRKDNELKTSFPVIRKVSSKMWFANTEQIKKAIKKFQ